MPHRPQAEIEIQPPMPRGTGLAIAFGIGAVSWAIVVAAALILLRY